MKDEKYNYTEDFWPMPDNPTAKEPQSGWFHSSRRFRLESQRLLPRLPAVSV